MASLAGKDWSLVIPFIFSRKKFRHITDKKSREHTYTLFKSLGLVKVPDLLNTNPYACLTILIRNAHHLSQTVLPTLGEKIGQKISFKKQSLAHFPAYCLPKIWSNLNISFKRLESIRLFKANLKELFR